MGKPVVGKLVVSLYSFATLILQFRRHEKSACPLCWDEALRTCLARITQRAGSRNTRPTCLGGHSGDVYWRASVFGPLLRGDTFGCAHAESQLLRSLSNARVPKTRPRRRTELVFYHATMGRARVLSPSWTLQEAGWRRYRHEDPSCEFFAKGLPGKLIPARLPSTGDGDCAVAEGIAGKMQIAGSH